MAPGSTRAVPERSFAEWLRNTVKVLCAQRNPVFRYERELRLCQFKAWLLGKERDFLTIQRAARTYAAARIAVKTKQVGQKRPKESPSSRLSIALKDWRLTEVFDFAFYPSGNLYLLFSSYPLKMLFYVTAKDREEIKSLNALTRWRLRLAMTKGFKPTLTLALHAYGATRNSEEEYGRTKVKSYHKARELREPFLFVAATTWSDLLQPESNMLGLLHEQAQETQLFRDYFARCQTALNLLKTEKPSAADLRAWSEVPPLPLEGIKPITTKEQESLGLYPEVRRSAETTKRAVRQNPL